MHESPVIVAHHRHHHHHHHLKFNTLDVLSEDDKNTVVNGTVCLDT